MTELLKSLLDKLNSVSAWIISKEERNTAELFLIKDKVDMNRACETLEYSVRLFVDFAENGSKYKGDATVIVSGADSPEEIEEKLQKAALAAGFVRNPWYDLPADSGEEVKKPETFQSIADLKAHFDEIHHILYKEYPYSSKMNSCELFAIESHRHVLTSKGVDVAYDKSEFLFEIVTDSSQGKEPVEIFNDYTLTSVDLKKLEQIVDKQLMETEGRALAVRNPKYENIRVILSGDAVEEFFYFYWEQANAAAVYQQMSRARLGERFLAKDAREHLNLRINPALKTAINAAPVDAEGTKLKAYPLIEDGVVKNFVTSAKFAQYLNIPHLGQSAQFEMDGGSESLSHYTQGEYIEILVFSSFLVDSATGSFGGEFRLAKHVKDGKVQYITGGSISENIFHVQNTMHFSKELEARKNTLTPKAVILDGVTVAGE